MSLLADRIISTTIPAVSLTKVAGGWRIRREGKGDTLFVTRDERARSPQVYLIIMHGEGVVGRAAWVEGEWMTERGVFRHWDQVGTPWQVFPSSTVHTVTGGPHELTELLAEEALYWLS